MLEPLEIQIARSKIRRYEHDADEALILESKQAQNCLDCEAFILSGIKALEWLERGEGTIMEAISEGIYEMTDDLEEAIETLHADWLGKCAFAEQWIAFCRKHGYDIKHLSAFRMCCERAKEWMDRNSQYKISKAAREERFAQEAW